MSADGERIYAPAGHPLAAGDVLSQPGLATALELVAGEGAGSMYRGSLAEALLGVEGIGVARDDLDALRGALAPPVELPYAGTRFLTRTGLSGVPESLARLQPLRDLGEKERVRMHYSPPSRVRPSTGTRRTSSRRTQTEMRASSRRASDSGPATSSPASTCT